MQIVFRGAFHALTFASARFILALKPISLSAVLFIGGESRRMGTDKATLMVAGKVMWSRQLETLHRIHPEKLLISARAKPAWAPKEIDIILDEAPSRGPLSGLVAALKCMKTTHMLVLAIDLPRMTIDHLLKLIQLATPDLGVIPKCGDFYEPLCAIYPASALLVAERALAEGRLSLQSLVHSLLQQNKMLIFSVSKEEEDLYFNLNSPGDLQQCRAQFS